MTRSLRRHITILVCAVALAASATVGVPEASSDVDALPPASGRVEVGPSGLFAGGFGNWQLEWFLSGSDVCSHIVLTTPADGRGKVGDCAPTEGLTTAVVDYVPANQSIIYGLVDQTVSDIEVCVLKGFPSSGICVTAPVREALSPVRSFAAVAPASTPLAEDSIPGEEGQELPQVVPEICVLQGFPSNGICVPIPEGDETKAKRRVPAARGLPVRVTAYDSRGRVVGDRRIPAAPREWAPRTVTRRQRLRRARCLRRARLGRTRTGRQRARRRCFRRYAPRHHHTP